MFPRRISLGAICFLRESRGILLESLEDLVKRPYLKLEPWGEAIPNKNYQSAELEIPW